LASFGTAGGRLIVVPVIVAVAAAVAVFLLLPRSPLTTQVVQRGLEHPWDIAFADDGRMLVTERGGRVRVFSSADPDAELFHTAAVADVRAELESGLMGIAIHADAVYVCATRGTAGSDPESWRIDLLRAELDGDGSISSFEPLPIGRTIGGTRHQGCAVEIGPDDHLWLTIGDANLPGADNPAQDPAALNGKVVRLTLDGAVPTDAPMPNGAYSLGHRNPQGIAFRPDGLAIAVEHGTDTNDEVNVLEPGANYGYPCVSGAGDPGPYPEVCEDTSAFRAAAWASGTPTIASSGAAFLTGSAWGAWEGNLLVTTLKEEDLRRFTVSENESVSLEDTLLDGRFGRLRAAVIGPDGALYLSTANGDDDRIVRVTPDEDRLAAR
jgi:glucose/arabinose dehydrogenase